MDGNRPVGPLRDSSEPIQPEPVDDSQPAFISPLSIAQAQHVSPSVRGVGRIVAPESEGTEKSLKLESVSGNLTARVDAKLTSLHAQGEAIAKDVQNLEQLPDVMASFDQWLMDDTDEQFFYKIRDSIVAGDLNADKTRACVDQIKQVDKAWEAAGEAKDSFTLITGTMFSIFGDRIVLPFVQVGGAVSAASQYFLGERMPSQFSSITGTAVDLVWIAHMFHDIPKTIVEASFLGMHATILARMWLVLRKMKADYAGSKDVVLGREIEVLERWLDEQGKANAFAWATLGITTVASLPSWIKHGGIVANWLGLAGGHAMNFSPAVTGVLGYGVLFGVVVVKGYELFSKEREWARVQGWMADVKMREYTDYYSMEFEQFVNSTLSSLDAKQIKKEFSVALGVPLEDFIPTGMAIKGDLVSLITGSKPLESRKEIIKLLENKEVYEIVFRKYKIQRNNEEYKLARGKFVETLEKEVFNTKDISSANEMFEKKFHVGLASLKFVGTPKTPAEYLRQFKANPQLFHQVLACDFKIKINVEKLQKKRGARQEKRVSQTKAAFDDLLDDFIDVQDPSLDKWKKKGLFLNRVVVKHDWINSHELMGNISEGSKKRWREQFDKTKYREAVDDDQRRLNLLVGNLKAKKVAVPKNVEFSSLSELQMQISYGDQKMFQEVLENSVREFILQKQALFDVEFVNVLNEAQKTTSLSKCVGGLWKYGIHIEDFTLADLEQSKRVAILNSPNVRDIARKQLHEQYVRHEEAMAVSTKNAMKALTTQKVKIEKTLWNVDVWMVRVALALVVLITVATVVTSIAAGIAISSVVPYAFLGFTAVAIGALVVGFLFLLIIKPNLANPVNYIRKAYIAFVKIPHAIQSFRLQLKEAKKARISSSFSSVRIKKMAEMRALVTFDPNSKILRTRFPDVATSQEASKKAESLRKELQKVFREHVNKLSKVDMEIKDLEKKVVYWEDKFKPAQQKIAHAGWRDFGDKLGFDSETDYPKAVAEAILSGESLPDPELERMLTKYLDIDLNAIKRAVDRRCENDEKKRVRIITEIQYKVENFFGGFANELLGVASRSRLRFE